jgi:hypothetical protein
MSKATAIRNLCVEHVNAIPVTVDWESVAAAMSDDGDPWCYEAVRCEECKAIVVIEGPGGNEEHRYVDAESDCRGHVPSVEGPMMAYAYRCDWRDASDAAERLVDLPVIPVILPNGDHALALTGGGQDLSWEICAAYVALGFLPPLHFAGDLPRIAGKYMGQSQWRTLAACLRSASVAAGGAKAAARRLREIRSECKSSARRAK